MSYVQHQEQNETNIVSSNAVFYSKIPHRQLVFPLQMNSNSFKKASYQPTETAIQR